MAGGDVGSARRARILAGQPRFRPRSRFSQLNLGAGPYPRDRSADRELPEGESGATALDHSATAVMLALPAVAGAAPREIDVGDDFFCPEEPPGPELRAGPSFRWSNGGGSSRHNIRQDDKLFFLRDADQGPDRLHDQRLGRLLPLLLHAPRLPQGGMAGGQGPSDRQTDSLDRRDRGPVGRAPTPTPAPASTSATGWTTGGGRPGRTTRAASTAPSAATTARQLQAQPPHLQDQGALGAPEGHEAQRLVAGAQARHRPRLSGPCEGCGRRPAAAAGRPRAAPSAAGRCGRRAGGPRRAPPGPGYGRRAATRSRG